MTLPAAPPRVLPETIVQAEGLGARYGARTVLDQIELTIRPGEIVGLLGANGAGKSTLLRCLLGLREPDAGTARLFGCTSTLLGAAEKARIGVVPQLAILHRWMRVEDHVAYVGAFYPRWDGVLVADLLARWQLPSRARVGQLSPGEQQRLALVLALGHRPALLLLDEPAASLDPVARRQAITALLERTASDGTTVLLSTHLTGDVERIASRVVILRAGRLVLDRDLEDVRERIVRLRLQADRPLPDLRLHGAIAIRARPDGAVVTIDGEVDAALAQCAALPGITAVVERLTLEDVFVDLHPCA